MSGGDDAVGYGRPPKSTRFQKGKSGNPKGRPKGSSNISTSIGRELNAKVQVREGGTARQIRKGDAIAKSLVNRAMTGDIRATAKVMEIDARAALPSTDAAHPAVPLTEDDWEVLEEFLHRVREASSIEAILDQLKDTRE